LDATKTNYNMTCGEIVHTFVQQSELTAVGNRGLVNTGRKEQYSGRNFRMLNGTSRVST